MQIDTDGHESYLPENFDSLQELLPSCVDDENLRFRIGGEWGLELTGITPYSRLKLDPAVNRTEEEILANGVHIQDVIKRRYKRVNCLVIFLLIITCQRRMRLIVATQT